MYQIVLAFAILLFFICSQTPCQVLALLPTDESSKRVKNKEIKCPLFNQKNEDSCQDRESGLYPCPH